MRTRTRVGRDVSFLLLAAGSAVWLLGGGLACKKDPGPSPPAGPTTAAGTAGEIPGPPPTGAPPAVDAPGAGPGPAHAAEANRTAAVDTPRCEDPTSETCSARCAAGVMAACAQIAGADFERGVTALRAACAGEHQTVCAQMTRDAMRQGDLPFSAALLTVLCDAEDWSACAALARTYDQGRGVPADALRAATLRERACEAGHADTCRDVGVALLGLKDVTDADRARAAKLLATGCAGRAAGPCAELASRAHEDGNDPLAAALVRAACDNGEAEACSNLGFLYERGLGVPADRDVALTFYQQACDGGSAAGCRNVAIFHESGTATAKDPAKAAALFQTACDAGGLDACRNLAASYLHGAGVPKDPARAREFLVKGCAGAEADRCGEIGEEAQAADDWSFAVLAYQVGCDAGSQQACVGLGVRYYDGVGISRDPEKAYALFAAACEAGNPVGCRNAASQHGGGDGAEWNDEKAVTFYRKACDLNDAPSCRALGHRYRAGSGVEKDDAKGDSLIRMACEGGMKEACEDLEAPPPGDAGE